LSYSIIENINHIDEIKHPAIKAALKNIKFKHGLEIHADSDLPARSGIGSSSTFIVGLLNALNALKGKRISMKALAEEAIRLEQDVIKEVVGSQDQVAAAYGGFNIINFQQSGSIDVDPVTIKKNRLEHLNKHLMLVFTGFSRNSTDIAKFQVENINKNKALIGKMQSYIKDAVKILEHGNDIREFGDLLHQSWVNKKLLTEKITTTEIDEIYKLARDSGAIGGKILGAGGGGFMLLFVEPSKQENIQKIFSDYVKVPFKFENSGSRIVYYNN
jgi:D-glycero-alpha-D-manno-heptose-7-phosphate kinase